MKTIFTTRLLAILILATAALTATARDEGPIFEQIEVDGVYYEVHDDKLEVIKHPQGYSGVVIIPETVMHGGKPYTVTRINNMAFYNCDGLLSIGISSTVNYIGPQCFMYCQSLEEIYVDPNNETYASYDRALYDKAMTTIIQCPQAVEEEYELPESVKSIKTYSFFNCKKIKKIILPNSVYLIDDDAFRDCINLESINLPDGITEIGSFCFGNCNSLKEITIPKNMTTIGYYAFSGCNALADVTNLATIPQTINEYTFSYFGTLHVPAGSKQRYAQARGWNKFNIVVDTTTVIDIDGIYYEIHDDKLEVVEHPQGYSGVVIIPETVMHGGKQYTVTAINSYAFKSCSALTNIKLPDGITAINDQTFYGCTALADINIPAGLTRIGSYAFSGCGIKEMHIPNHVTEIGEQAFQNCKQLEHLTLPDNMTSIPDGLLSNCTSLTEINIPQGVTSIGSNAFSGCKSLKKVKLPDGVTSISPHVFNGCTNLESVYLPDGIIKIEQYCFRNCKSLKEITIPKNTETIGYYAFSGCNALADVTNLSAVPQTIDEETFSNFGTLHVPAGSEQLYAQAEGWNKFNIVGDATVQDAIYNIKADQEQTTARYYGIDGRMRQTETHKGITIVKTMDGKTRKVMNKK